MTEPQPFDAVDALYRRTFEDLPPSPASSGWDSPSPRVWDNILRRMPQTRGGWPISGWLLTGLLMVFLGLGIWLWLTPDEQAAAKPPQVEQAAPSPSTGISAADISPVEPIQAAAPEPAVMKPDSKPPASKSPKAPKVAASVQEASSIREMTAPPAQAEAAVPQAPPAAPRYPNNAERRRAEALKKQWETPLQPLPGVLEKHKRW